MAIASSVAIGSFLILDGPSDATPSSEPVANSSLPIVVAKVVKRNVYDNSAKVGEITYTIRKTTTGNPANDTIEILTPAFEITNIDYLSNTTPLPTTEVIPIFEAPVQEEGLHDAELISMGSIRTNEGFETDTWGGNFPTSAEWDDVETDTGELPPNHRVESTWDLPVADASYDLLFSFFTGTTQQTNGFDWDDVFSDPDDHHTCYLNYYNKDFYGISLVDGDILELEVKEETP